MDNQYITILDYVLLPFVLLIIYGIAYRYRNKHYGPKHPWRKYFIPALSVKVFGAIFIGLIYQYYYGGGDTFNFFKHAKIINSAFNESGWKWLNLLLHIPRLSDGNYYEYISRLPWYTDTSSYTIASIAAFFGIFTFNTYLPATVLFAALSFTGVWALFRTFAAKYPAYIQPVAIAILFIPSTFVWGSGIFKDTICLFGLGWLTYGTFRFLIQKDFSIRNILLATISFLLIVNIKVYILLGFIPALLLWILFLYLEKVRSKSGKFLLRIIFLAVSITIFLVFMQQFGNDLGKYSLEEIARTSELTRGWIGYVSEVQDGASYDLGAIDPSIGGMLLKFPAAINVTLFRPYIWEAGKPIVMLSAIEAFFFLIITIRVFFSLGLKKIWLTISSDPTIQFCLIFSLIFAFAVGISTSNFGALSRYKIPCLSFYLLALLLIYYKNKSAKLFVFI